MDPTIAAITPGDNLVDEFKKQSSSERQGLQLACPVRGCICPAAQGVHEDVFAPERE
jgi:hypothetical protein